MNESCICSICNKKCDNYDYSYFVREYNKESSEVCRKCQGKIERKSNYYFRNHLPGFVSGKIETIIFNNKNELKEYLLSLNNNDNWNICISADHIIKINNNGDQWWVLGYYYSKTKLDLPKFEDYYNKEI